MSQFWMIENMDKKHGQQYGMPSGHAQLVSNIGTFIILYFLNIYINIVVLTQIFITCWHNGRTELVMSQHTGEMCNFKYLSYVNFLREGTFVT